MRVDRWLGGTGGWVVRWFGGRWSVDGGSVDGGSVVGGVGAMACA